MTTGLYLLRAKQMGLTLHELDELEEGFVTDMIIESSNDNEADSYSTLASQEDFNRF